MRQVRPEPLHGVHLDQAGLLDPAGLHGDGDGELTGQGLVSLHLVDVRLTEDLPALPVKLHQQRQRLHGVRLLCQPRQEGSLRVVH